MASALFKLSSNDGASYLSAGTALADGNALAYVASGTYSIRAALDSTAGVASVAWTLTSADDAHIDALPAVTTHGDKTCTFSVPRTGGAWLLQCKVNGGVNPATGAADPALTRALAVKVLNAAGLQEIAVGETTEAGSYGWTKAVNDGQRAHTGAPTVGVESIDLGALDSAVLTLTEDQADHTVLVFTGAPVDDPVISFPVTNGLSWIVVNATTDGARLFAVKAAGGSRLVYLLPGQQRTVYVRGGEAYAPDEKALVGEVTVSLIRGSTGTTDTSTMRLPPGTRLTRHSVLGVVAVVGGTSAITAGTSAGGTQVQTSQAAPAVGAVLGDASAHWGSDLSATGSAYYSAGQQLSLRNTVTGSATTAGSVRVIVEGCLL